MNGEHGAHMHGHQTLHDDVVGLVDLKNFTAVLHEDVQAVGGLRLVRARHHAEGESGHVARA